MRKLTKICSAGSKENLEALINKFYYSENYFINSQGEAENKKTGKKFGKVEVKKGRYTYLN